MLRFGLLGFPIAIHWIFWVNVALISGGMSAQSPEAVRALIIKMFAAFLSILIHELGHALLMRHYGARASILLYAFGGLAIPDRGFNRVQQILVSLAGPFVQIALGVAVFFLLAFVNPELETLLIFLGYFALVSIFWGVLNLIPVYPLDGGHVLASVLGPRRMKTVYLVGIVCSIAMGAGLWIFFGPSLINILLCGMLAYENYKRLRGETPSSFLHPH